MCGFTAQRRGLQSDPAPGLRYSLASLIHTLSVVKGETTLNGK